MEKNNNNNVNLAPKRTIKTFIFIIGGITTMTCAGILIIIPLLKRVNIEIESEAIYGIEDTTWIFDDDAYQQHSNRTGYHSHWMGDPKGRKEYGSPDETYIDDKGNIRKKKMLVL